MDNFLSIRIARYLAGHASARRAVRALGKAFGVATVIMGFILNFTAGWHLVVGFVAAARGTVWPMVVHVTLAALYAYLGRETWPMVGRWWHRLWAHDTAAR